MVIYTLHRDSPKYPAERVAYEGIEKARKKAVSLIERGRAKNVYILDSNLVLTGKVFRDMNKRDRFYYRDYKKAIVRIIDTNGKTVTYK